MLDVFLISFEVCAWAQRFGFVPGRPRSPIRRASASNANLPGDMQLHAVAERGVSERLGGAPKRSLVRRSARALCRARRRCSLGSGARRAGACRRSCRAHGRAFRLGRRRHARSERLRVQVTSRCVILRTDGFGPRAQREQTRAPMHWSAETPARASQHHHARDILHLHPNAPPARLRCPPQGHPARLLLLKAPAARPVAPQPRRQ